MQFGGLLIFLKYNKNMKYAMVKKKQPNKVNRLTTLRKL